jgi:hypothetical protein
MQQPMQPIIQHLFQVSSLEDVSRQRLEAFVEEYPSFGIGHYLLSRKLKSEGSERFARVTQKTGLYFTNPFWLQWQLEHIPFAGNRPETEIAAEPALMAQSVLHAGPVPPAENGVTVPEETFELPVGDDFAEAISDGKEERLTTEEKEGMTAGEGEAIEGQPVQPINMPEESKEPSAAELLLRSIQEAKDLRESLHRLNNDFTEETAVAGETIPIEAEKPVDAIPEPEEPTQEPVKVAEEPIKDEETPFVLEEMEAPEVPAPFAEAALMATAPPAAEPTLAAPVAEPAFVFEPFHTIDYFASQGIKLTLDENPSDVLGKQVKSFTDWLKGMKRLPQKDREVVPDRVAEQAVQTIAAHSIEGKEVLTETMAEVLAKQGMREKARVVYEKLSLLNPEKRAYFATKIEQLNIF